MERLWGAVQLQIRHEASAFLLSEVARQLHHVRREGTRFLTCDTILLPVERKGAVLMDLNNLDIRFNGLGFLHVTVLERLVKA